MATGMTFRLDAVGDALYIDVCAPYAEQISEEVGDGVVARLNPQTGEVENVAVLFFTKRLELGQELNIPLVGHLRLAA
jgi:hypothetical protein